MSSLGKVEAAPTPWANLRAAFERARDAEIAFDNGVYERALALAKAQRTSVDDGLNDISEKLGDLRVVAEEAMALSPAPNIAATLYKIEYARTRWRDCDDWPDEWWASVLSDLRRYAGKDAASLSVSTASSTKYERSSPAGWRQAEGWFRSLADVEIEGMPEEVRSAVDHALCLTMNHLVEAAPAPDVDALLLKMEIVRDCSDAGLPSHWWYVLQADVSRLVGRPSAPSEGSELDRLIAVYANAEQDLAQTRGLPDGNPIEVRFLAALAELDAYEPKTPDEFVKAISARFSKDAPPTNETVADLVATAQRLNAGIFDGATKGDAE